MKTSDGRDAVVNKIDDKKNGIDISIYIPRNIQPKTDLTNIVDQCASRPSGLHRLLVAVYESEGESRAMGAVYTVMAEIASAHATLSADAE